MAKIQRHVGTTSEILQVFIQDSSSTTGAGLTGLTNASGGLTAYYMRNTANAPVAISLVSMTLGTFTSGGFKEVDATNLPGVYQFCPPNAALVTGADSVTLFLKGATNMAPLPLEIELTQTDNQDGVAGGISNTTTAVSNLATVLSELTTILSDLTTITVVVSQIQTSVDTVVIPNQATIISDIGAVPDNVLKRDWTFITGAPSFCLLNSARASRNRVVVQFTGPGVGTVTVYEENGTTIAWTGALTTDPTATLITSVTP